MDFGYTKDGEKIQLVTLKNKNIECSVTTFGASLQSIKVPDKNGVVTDVLLGMDDGEGYERQDASFGATVGRFANRIAGGHFVLNGEEYNLVVNNGPNHLHGGNKGFNRRVWYIEEVTDTSVTMSRLSPDGEEFYPGNLKIYAKYQLTENAVEITYTATTDKDTVINITNHAYFNLDGHDSGDILDTYLRFYAAQFTPADDVSVPTGEIIPVDDTVMDFKDWHRIGERIFTECDWLKWGNGYDHNWVIDGREGDYRLAAEAYSKKSGILMKAYTTQPGMQFYTGNYTGSIDNCKGGVKYVQRAGFCLEMQNFPDRIHHPNFPSAVLKAGEEFCHKITYSFEVCDTIE